MFVLFRLSSYSGGFVRHNIKPTCEGIPMIARVQEIIENQVRPILQADGGDIELIDLEDGIVKVRLVGACAHCPSSALTLYEGVEKMLKDLLPEIKGIEQVW